ncbi:hypothetical protein JHK82_044125 [Glycine max]|nr:hypothetical protein JHK86_057255 [Glycine max]KAG4914228.1 hypothetical protein JHK87_051785 [Glycine soja]KAG4906034.1 hypothetical protein JHK86_057281 [Glycine max]KAG4906132.1 hypothetical protein JHK86_057334 [Glycine max]KAG4906134.1 hypothetical protein JHK86_057317 [Glycine max]
MFFSIYHHYGPYGQIDVVRIIVCPFEKDECENFSPISPSGFNLLKRSAGIIEKRKALYVLVLGAPVKVNSLLVFTFGHQESRTDSLALLCKGLTSDVWKYVVEVNSSEMQPEGNLSFDPVWYVFCASFLSYWLRFSCLGHLILWFQHMAMVQIQTKDFLSCFDLSGSRVLLLTIQSSHSFKTMHGMLFQLCVHVLIFVMLAFFYCLIAWQLFKIFRIVTAPFIAIRETALFPQDGPSCFCLMETRVQVQTFRNQDMAGAGFEPAIFSFPGVGKAKWGHPSPLSALPRAIDIIRSTEIDFAENQLYPILVGLSPLATSHPRILPHTWVRSSKSKERRLAAELGYGFPIGDPWITDGISPWPFASESVLPSQCPGIHPMHSFRSCTQTNECANAAFASIPCLFASHRLHKRYTEDQPNLDENQYTQLHLQIQRASERTLCH